MRILFFLLFVSFLTNAQERISDFYWPTNSGSNPAIIYVDKHTNEAFFLASNNHNQIELWTSNGTNISTKKVKVSDANGLLNLLYQTKLKDENTIVKGYRSKAFTLMVLNDPSSNTKHHLFFDREANELKRFELGSLSSDG